MAASDGLQPDYQLYRIATVPASMEDFRVKVAGKGMNYMADTEENNLSMDVDKLIKELFKDEVATSKASKNLDAGVKSLLKTIGKRQIEDFLNDHSLQYFIYAQTADTTGAERRLSGVWRVRAFLAAVATGFVLLWL